MAAALLFVFPIGKSTLEYEVKPILAKLVRTCHSVLFYCVKKPKREMFQVMEVSSTVPDRACGSINYLNINVRSTSELKPNVQAVFFTTYIV